MIQLRQITSKILSFIEALFKNLDKVMWLLISTLVPRNDKIMVFGAWFAQKYEDNTKYLFEYALTFFSQYQLFWITDNERIYNKLCNKKLPVLLGNSLKAKYTILRAKFIFISTSRSDVGKNNVKYQGGAYCINLWHGIPLKKILYDNNYSFKLGFCFYIRDLLKKIPYRNYFVISSSECVSKIYMSAFNLKKSHVLELGQPRNDYFFKEHINPYRQQYFGKKIIIYMPTHRNEGQRIINLESIFDLNSLENLCNKYNAVFLIKKHFYHSNFYPMTKDNSMIEPDKSLFIKDITNDLVDTQALLDSADVLITDYSSCYIDYLLLKRPIIFYNYDLSEYMSQDRQLYFDYNKVTPGKKCATFTELEFELQELLSGNDEYQTEREKIKNMFYSKKNQSTVSKRIIDTIIEM